MNILIVSGGEEPSCELLNKISKKSDYIIGVDRGCNYLYKNNIKPQYIMGDFDSIDKKVLKFMKDKNVKFKEFNPEKDFTDTEEAFDFAISELKPTNIYLLGGTGKRLDHFIANLGLLKKSLEKNIKAYIIDDYNEIYLINKPQEITGDKGGYISFQGYNSIVKGFTIKNAKYELDNYDLSFGDPLTVSNEFLDKPIKLQFEKGIIIIIKSYEN